MSDKQLFVTRNITDNHAYQTSKSDKGDVEGVSTLRWVGDKCYQWVQNRSAAGLVAGEIVFHTFSNGADAEKWVTGGVAADLSYMAGVVASTTIAVGDTSPSTNYSNGGFGWVQKSGISITAHVLRSETTIGTVGGWLFGANSVNYCDAGTAIAMGTAKKYHRGLILMEECTTNTTAATQATKVLVECL